MDAVEGELAEANGTIDALKRSKSRLEGEIEEMVVQLTQVTQSTSNWNYSAERDGLVKERDGLADSLRRANEKILEDEALLNDLYALKSAMQGRLAELEKSLDVMKAKEVKAVAMTAELENYSESLRATANSLQIRISDLEKDKNDLSANVDALTAASARLEEENRRLVNVARTHKEEAGKAVDANEEAAELTAQVQRISSEFCFFTYLNTLASKYVRYKSDCYCEIRGEGRAACCSRSLESVGAKVRGGA